MGRRVILRVGGLDKWLAEAIEVGCRRIYLQSSKTAFPPRPDLSLRQLGPHSAERDAYVMGVGKHGLDQPRSLPRPALGSPPG